MQINHINPNQQIQRQNLAKETTQNNNAVEAQDYQQAPLGALQAYSKINFNGSRHKANPKTVIILLGAPGSGKGTYSEIIENKYGIPKISTGDILKKEMKAESDLGLKAKSYINDGVLVPDSLIIDIVKQRINESDCKKGFILDGFPRTEAQAKKLNEMLGEMPNVKLKVMNLDVPEEVLYERSANRLVCSDCSKSFNIKEYEKENCDKDGCKGTLVKRSDDNPETLTKRLEEYHEKTQPVANFYAKDGKLKNIQIAAKVGSDCNIEDIMDQLVDEIDN